MTVRWEERRPLRVPNHENEDNLESALARFDVHCRNQICFANMNSPLGVL